MTSVAHAHSHRAPLRHVPPRPVMPQSRRRVGRTQGTQRASRTPGARAYEPGEALCALEAQPQQSQRAAQRSPTQGPGRAGSRAPSAGSGTRPGRPRRPCARSAASSRSPTARACPHPPAGSRFARAATRAAPRARRARPARDVPHALFTTHVTSQCATRTSGPHGANMRIEMKCGLHTILTIYLLSHACANGRRIRHKMRISPAPCRTLGRGTSSARARLARVVRPDGLRRHARPVQQLPAGQVAPGQAPAERLADRRPAARARLLGQHTRTQLPEVQVRRQARHCARVRKLPLRLVPREACARRTWPCKCGRVPYCACALPNQRMQQLSHLAGMSDAFLVTQ